MASDSRSMAAMTALLTLAVFIAASHSLVITDNWTDGVPNINSAMTGYNVYFADSFSKPDPGVRNQIFTPLQRSDLVTGKVQYNSFVGISNEEVYCDKEFSSVTVQNMAEYSEMQSSSKSRSRDSFLHSRSKSKQETSVENFFQKTNGEIVVANAACVAYSVGLYYFEKPTFTDGFVDALRALNKEAVKSESQSNQTFVNFVNDFGTHFMKHTDLGAKMFYLKSFYEKTTSQLDEDTRSKCVSREAGFTMNLQEIFQAAEIAVKAIPLLARGLGTERDHERCKESKTSNYTEDHTTAEIRAQVLIGSMPSMSFEDWAKDVLVHPVPISFELEEMTSLFRPEWLDDIPQDPENPEGKTLNSTAMTKYFNINLANYCYIIDGEDCQHLTGCGYNDNCPSGTVCHNDNTTAAGFYCVQTSPKYGGIVLAGGTSDNDKSEGYMESFGAVVYPQPSDLPDLYASVTAVRSTLYLCGQYDGTQNEISCYSIHADGSGEWTKVEGQINLPSSVSSTRHTAVAVSTHIWFVFKDIIYDYNTESNAVIQYSTPFQTHISDDEIHCSVSNASHSFVIGVGEKYDEIWVNTEPNNPESWYLFAHLKEPRTQFGCVWNEGQIYSTGGQTPSSILATLADRSTALEDTTATPTTTSAPPVPLKTTEMLDSISQDVNEGKNLTSARYSHRMFILDNIPAVVGGVDSGNNLDTVEVLGASAWQTDYRKIQWARGAFSLAQLQL